MITDPADLSGTTLVVTGASSGIGAALAVEASRRGGRVAIVARRADRLDEVRVRCAEFGHDPVAVAADLSDLDAIDALVTRLTNALDGRIDVLVNNAGVPKRRRTDELTAADVEDVMRINYFSPVRMTLSVLPQMLARDDGDVVNVSSMGVHSATYGVSAYSASKAALELFTEGLYLELGRTGVRAHLFVPGTTISEFSSEKPGNNAPFPLDPSMASTSEQVAVALLDSLVEPGFRSFTGEREATTAAKREADVNGWLTTMRGVFSKS